MDKKKRIKCIDLCKGLGILLVTWGHITKLGNPVDVWASSIKMPIFFIAAGYLICYTDSYRRMTLKEYAWKLLKSLGIPYVTFSIASIGFRFLSMVMKHAVDMAAIKSYIFATISLRGVFALWFLPVLLIAELLFYCIVRYGNRWIWGVLPLILPISSVLLESTIMNFKAAMAPLMFERVSFFMLTIGKIIIALWFLQMGYLSCRLLQKIQGKQVRFFIGILFTGMNLVLSQKNLGVDLNNMALGESKILFFFCGVIGSLGILLMFEFLENYWSFHILNYFGKNSLILMCTQRPFYIISTAAAGWKIISGMPGVLAWRYYVDCTGILILVLIIEYSVITFMNTKGKFMLGKVE